MARRSSTRQAAGGGARRASKKPSAKKQSAKVEGREPKSILLFSDGTGNSSAKLFKTNVWRMYEAVDLGPSPKGKRDQISFYDDGVGTSGFKLLAALGGAFGWGLKRNVLDIYRYACRNYRDGDQIYGFGFSRGAFTMRLVIALIATQGLVTSRDDAELDRRSRHAYRAFRAAFLPRKLKKPTILCRRLRDRWEARRERRQGDDPYDPSKNLHPVIRFVGVWDTVAAYGGPIAEITRAIDNWIYPLSMPDYELNEKVECARHALSLDDEREAFQPLLWDEVHEDALIEKGKVGADRLQQVWFTGMHADVGGGYPDESLSFVSLLWMMEEAKKADLRILDVIKKRFVALANSYGPIHDSRSGLGAYYRYQPRKVAAWIDPLHERYRMLQDPDVAGPGNPEHGLLRRVHVHESVVARIDSGTDRYAPVALPEHFDVIPPQKEGETVVQADNETGKTPDKPRASAPLIGPLARSRLQASNTGRFACQENLWDLVWSRRIAYFATVAATFLLVVLPLWAPLSFLERSCSDQRCVLQDLIGSGEKISPGFADPWIDAFAHNPVTALLLAVAISMLLGWGKSLEGRLRDSMHRLWRVVFDGGALPEDQCAPTRLRKWRESPRYQKLFRVLKWYVLPAIFGIVMLLMILYVPFVALTQASLAVEETNHHFCPQEETGKLAPLEHTAFAFDTSSSCVATGGHVKKGQVYDIVFELPLRHDNGDPAPWWDGIKSHGDPTGIRAVGLAQMLGVPLRRMITARYLQPLAQITIDHDPNPGAVGRLFRRYFSSDWVDVRALNLKQDGDWPELYRIRFTAQENGSLHFFANDAQLPFGWGQFLYGNNCGTALVTITHILPRRRGQKPQELIREPSGVVPLPPCASGRKAPLP